MGIPDTVSKRQFPATGKWEPVQVFDGNWEKEVPGVVDPDGQLTHVYDGAAPYWIAVHHAYQLNEGGDYAVRLRARFDGQAGEFS
jgi:hypothetical protein